MRTVDNKELMDAISSTNKTVRKMKEDVDKNTILLKHLLSMISEIKSNDGERLVDTCFYGIDDVVNDLFE
ncbi:hypothetical protein [Clostridium sp. 'White wine YQ']|uniref:hypothetical protein n=1 Tax=Clostridium sp. 'White wine YQ' TaxID=3027474 RepID=UPI002366B62A|nr:hypothetical protein [Clostridium sp. 'White wine YQ']MDD7794744.1 hypothetical protein [Clostridium sp. 'White wine YQ']